MQKKKNRKKRTIFCFAVEFPVAGHKLWWNFNGLSEVEEGRLQFCWINLCTQTKKGGEVGILSHFIKKRIKKMKNKTNVFLCFHTFIFEKKVRQISDFIFSIKKIFFRLLRWIQKAKKKKKIKISILSTKKYISKF